MTKNVLTALVDTFWKMDCAQPVIQTVLNITTSQVNVWNAAKDTKSSWINANMKMPTVNHSLQRAIAKTVNVCTSWILSSNVSLKTTIVNNTSTVTAPNANHTSTTSTVFVTKTPKAVKFNWPLINARNVKTGTDLTMENVFKTSQDSTGIQLIWISLLQMMPRLKLNWNKFSLLESKIRSIWILAWRLDTEDCSIRQI